ncbi:gluconate 2-dehydrogenase subunit 3 family protein [Paracoccus shanxieyensis]|uniref:Gluconate 2-dehydrogenase subunit 3 family protein n=1 Tax=Paracoccus shanxieyensis TaxID=2675752 RepID=A0A6L6J2V8_9RHOB|nr:gluconate 2-dehydrogenase subunit 3 family protein [Paracoccus shanxieyensis]MTH66499.1 gluconate 2-dehydrogenase subunit 3 family protein [Paracoccus shanxieyensis]MTH89719.1 gluconate 2-dehydrogenase subunit 3 family protein [Paracoccus shanxieyensis]
MLRRDFLTMIAAVTGTAMIGGRAMAYLPTEAGANAFTPEDTAFLDEMAEVILPRTDTPGAKDAGVGAFMTLYVSDCYTPEDQQGFRDGMANLKAAAAEQGTDFMQMTPDARTALLDGIAREARVVTAEGAAKAKAEGRVVKNADMHWFTPLHQLVLFGFFTSEIGATEVLRYEPVPGEYIGDLDYDGEPAWAT